MRDTLMSAARGVALAVALLALLGLAARQTKLLDRYFIFFPERELVRTPGDVDVEYEEAFFSTSDGVRLHGWFVPSQSDTTLVWFHGNAGNISHRLENIKLLHERLGVSILIFDYRGYGRSGGRISEEGTYLDGEGALLYLRSRRDIRADMVVLFGRSLGSAVAVDVATRYPAYGLILESPFTSVADMAKGPIRYLPVSALIGIRYDSLAKIRGISAPLLVLHGDQDTVVPIKYGKLLFDAASRPKEFYTIAGAGHNDTYIVGGQEYFTTLSKFIEALAQ